MFFRSVQNFVQKEYSFQRSGVHVVIEYTADRQLEILNRSLPR